MGIHNLGATCYMASLMQQLYMCPDLTNGLLRARADAAGAHVDMVRELQLLLASLRYSERCAFAPHGFCESYRDFEGRCIEPQEQRDADEFLHELLQRLEEALGAKHPLLDRLFGGTLAQQVIWTDRAGEEQMSEHVEPFRVLPVDIKGFGSLQAALDAYVSGEPLQG